jgi:hypothetical protein
MLDLAMARKPQQPRSKNDPEQHKRFIDMAREVEADETPGALDRAFGRIADKITSKPNRQSDIDSAGKRAKP